MADKKKEFFKTKVYYGEYTLRHWLDLMLSRNITLPEYQRHFVWGESDVRRLMDSLKSGQFIMPVTIAHYNDSVSSENIILDGQQRLTSILLAYLGYMPIKDKFITTEDDLAMGDDSQEDEIGTPMEWTFKKMLADKAQENTIPLVIERLRKDNRYSEMKIEFDGEINDFYDNTYLGFSYIIPDNGNPISTQNYFSTLFRHMNYFGKKLSPLESRRSLYFMNIEYKNYFEGRLEKGNDVLCGIRLLENKIPKKIDFVRYLSMLSQYTVSKNVYKVMVGYSAYSSRENYFADYVAYLAKLEQDVRKDKFDGFKMEEIFPQKEWVARFEIVKSFIESHKKDLGLDEKVNAFTSWIDSDYWLFGLLYFVVFEGKKIVKDKELIDELRKEIKVKRDLPPADDYSKNPNRLGNLRDRMKLSIDIYARYAE
jgi:hypothetical protein